MILGLKQDYYEVKIGQNSMTDIALTMDQHI